MMKKNKIDLEYKTFEKDIHKIAYNQIKNIETEVNKIRKEVEEIGEEVDNAINEKSVKSKKSLKNDKK
jgi:hypothetical protein